MQLRRMSYKEFVAFVAMLSITIATAIDAILPGLSDIKESFGLAPESNSVALAITVYFLGMSIAQLVYGPLADHFGRKPILYVGLIVYIAGAIGSALSPSLAVLLLSRFIWGVGAAALRVLGIAIVRDVFDGDRMARVMSLVMTAFLLGPIFAPLLGQGILLVASWRWIFGFAALVAVATVLWGTRLEETLDPNDRLPLGFSQTGQAIGAVLRTRSTVGFSIAQMFVFGNLLMFLASSELLFEVVYDRGASFAIAFSASSVLSAITAYSSSRVVERLGMLRVMTAGAVISILASGVLTIASIAGNGQPAFWLWWPIVAIVVATFSLTIPTGSTLSVQPMGHLAGTASAVVGTFSMGGGAVLGAIVDRTLSDSVTPQSIGFLAFSLCTFAAIKWATRSPENRPSPSQVSSTPTS